jgi:hypothetical protein
LASEGVKLEEVKGGSGPLSGNENSHKKETREAELYKMLKKLVESPAFDYNPATLLSTKDIFNALSRRIIDWHTFLKDQKEAGPY